MASAASINLLAHSSLSQTHRKNDISISFERHCREIGKSMGPIDFQYVCSLPPGINTTAKSIGITSYQLSNLFCSRDTLYILQHFLQLLHRRPQHLPIPQFLTCSHFLAPGPSCDKLQELQVQSTGLSLLCVEGVKRSLRGMCRGCVRAALTGTC